MRSRFSLARPKAPPLNQTQNICVIRPEQRSNIRLKGQAGKPLLRLKGGFSPLLTFEPSGSLHDIYIRTGTTLRLDGITSYYQQYTGYLIRIGCLVHRLRNGGTWVGFLVFGHNPCGHNPWVGFWVPI